MLTSFPLKLLVQLLFPLSLPLSEADAVKGNRCPVRIMDQLQQRCNAHKSELAQNTSVLHQLMNKELKL
jgi:hypothetical protein